MQGILCTIYIIYLRPLAAQGILQTRRLSSPACDAIETRSASHGFVGRHRAFTHLAGLSRLLWFAVDALCRKRPSVAATKSINIEFVRKGCRIFSDATALL